MNKILKSKRIATSLILSLILSLTGVTNVFAFSNVENNTNIICRFVQSADCIASPNRVY